MCQQEQVGKLPFLDTSLVHHPDGTITTSVYCKKTHTDCYLDFQSHHPLAHKVAVICTLLSRPGRICSSPEDRSTEEEHVTEALHVNGYPQQLISRHSHPRRQLASTRTSKSYVVLPYIRGMSELIHKILTPLGNTTQF